MNKDRLQALADGLGLQLEEYESNGRTRYTLRTRGCEIYGDGQALETVNTLREAEIFVYGYDFGRERGS
jgi:hypothetical protein